jgi:hypothetical protein
MSQDKPEPIAPEPDEPVALEKKPEQSVLSLEIYQRALAQTAKQFRWNTSTLTTHMNRYLPSVVEQALYLSIAPDFRHRPKTVAIVLRRFFGEQELKAQDLIKYSPEGQYPTSTFDQLLPKIEQVLELILRVKNDYEDLRLGADTAACLVEVYGDNANVLIESIFNRIEEIRRVMKCNKNSMENTVARKALKFWAITIYPYCRTHDVPDFLEFMDFFDNDEVGTLREDAAAFCDDEVEPDATEEED